MFKKVDLKNGMVVQVNNGSKRLFFEGRLIDDKGDIYLDRYDENLKHLSRLFADFDIDKIYILKDINALTAISDNNNLIEIWSRYQLIIKKMEGQKTKI